jgi:hypothetical protein
VDACTSSYVTKWLFYQHLEWNIPFECKPRNQGV